MKKFGHAGDDEKYKFYAKRQLVQKILLNSLYGVLGLPAFRFYDLDNAEAVTTTGQTVIKNTAEVANIKYNKEIYSKERILVNGTKELRLTEYVDIVRNGETLNVQAHELQENDELVSI